MWWKTLESLEQQQPEKSLIKDKNLYFPRSDDAIYCIY